MSLLFQSMVDYAGLFPPASCSMAVAVEQYASYRAGPDRAFLGRFVVAAARLEELGATLAARTIPPSAEAPWLLSVVLGSNVAADLDRVTLFAASPASVGTRVESLECKATSPGQVTTLAAQMPDSVERYFEVPTEEPYGELIKAIAAAGAFAKVRTGGVTPEAFPSADQLTRFLLAVSRSRLPFKATAGLHHPLRGDYPLTYAPDAARHTMYGFLNLLLATAELARGGSGETAQAILEEENPARFARVADGWRWRHLTWSGQELIAARTTGFTSFGSWSFTEPVDDLAALEAR